VSKKGSYDSLTWVGLAVVLAFAWASKKKTPLVDPMGNPTGKTTDDIPDNP
jgi:hypothetical protein